MAITDKSIISKKRAIPQSSPVSDVVLPTILDKAIMKEITATDLNWKKHIIPRMDEDEKLWTDEPFTLRDSKGDALEDVENVTLPDARIYGERVIAVLNESVENISINGQRNGKVLNTKMTKIIEDFFHDVVYIADERQNDILMPGLAPYFWEQIAIRGGTFARILLAQDRHGFDPDILPLDRYKVRYGLGRRGFTWFGFWDTLSREEVLDEYPGYTMKGDFALRWDYWNSTEEIIFLDGDFHAAYDNLLGYPPFIGELCQQGTFLETTPRALRMRGDSIFSSSRELYPHLNKIASILQTQGMLSLAPPQVLESISGKKLPGKPIYRLGNVMALQKGESLVPIEAPDIIGAMRFFNGMLGATLQRATLTHVEWGNLQFQLSNVALATLGTAARQVYSPRLHTMERFKRKMEKEIRSQFIRFDMTADIGRTGNKHTYTKADLEGNFTVDFEYLTALPEEVAASYGLADMAKAGNWMDDKTTRRVILKYRDPDDISEKVMVQQAQRVSKALALFTMAKALDEQAESEKRPELKDQAKILLIEVGQTLEGRTGEALAQITGMEVPKAKQIEQAPTLPKAPSTREQERPGVAELEKEGVEV